MPIIAGFSASAVFSQVSCTHKAIANVCVCVVVAATAYYERMKRLDWMGKSLLWTISRSVMCWRSEAPDPAQILVSDHHRIQGST